MTKPLMEAVYASGFVVADNEYEITAQVEGYLVEILVKEGATIKKEQPLFVIESQQQNARFAIAQETYKLAVENEHKGSPVIGELEASLASAQSKMKFDSINSLRYDNLIRQKVSTQIEVDRMKLAYENSRNDYRLQFNRLRKTRNQLRTDYENARRQLDISKEESGRYVVKSKIDGLLLSTTKEKNEMIRRGEVIGRAGDAQSFYLKLAVDEIDMRKVSLKQDILVKVEAYPDQIFHGKVTKLYPLVDSQQQSIRVDAQLNEAMLGWYSGMSVEANIVIRQKDKALVISKSLLLEGDSVWIHTADGDRKIKVQTGIETMEEVEIIEGLSSSTPLIVKE